MTKVIICSSIFFIIGKINCFDRFDRLNVRSDFGVIRDQSENQATETSQRPSSPRFQRQRNSPDEQIIARWGWIQDGATQKSKKTGNATPSPRGDGIRWLPKNPCNMECLLERLNAGTITGKPKTFRQNKQIPATNKATARGFTWGWGPEASTPSSSSKDVNSRMEEPPAIPRPTSPSVKAPAPKPSKTTTTQNHHPQPSKLPNTTSTENRHKPQNHNLPSPKPHKTKKPLRIVNFSNSIVRATFTPLVGKPKLQTQLLKLLFGVQFLNFAFVPKVLSPGWDRHLADFSFNPQLLHAVISPQLLSPNLQTSLINARFEPGLLNLGIVPQLLSPEIKANLLMADVRDPNVLGLLLRPRALSPEINLQLLHYKPKHWVLFSLLQPSVFSPRIWLNLLALYPAKLIASQELNGGVFSPDIFASLNQGLLIQNLNGFGGPGFGSGDPITFKLPGT